MQESEYNKEATDLLHKQIFDSLRRIEEDMITVKEQVKYTNGKLKKLTIALIAVAAFALGTGLQNAKLILSFLL